MTAESSFSSIETPHEFLAHCCAATEEQRLRPIAGSRPWDRPHMGNLVYEIAKDHEIDVACVWRAVDIVRAGVEGRSYGEA